MWEDPPLTRPHCLYLGWFYSIKRAFVWRFFSSSVYQLWLYGWILSMHERSDNDLNCGLPLFEEYENMTKKKMAWKSILLVIIFLWKVAQKSCTCPSPVGGQCNGYDFVGGAMHFWGTHSVYCTHILWSKRKTKWWRFRKLKTSFMNDAFYRNILPPHEKLTQALSTPMYDV